MGGSIGGHSSHTFDVISLKDTPLSSGRDSEYPVTDVSTRRVEDYSQRGRRFTLNNGQCMSIIPLSHSVKHY